MQAVENSLKSCFALAQYSLKPCDGRAQGSIWEMPDKGEHEMARVTAMSSIAYAHYTLYEALPRIAARGFSRVEIGSFSTYCFHFNFGSPTPGELKNMLAQHDLTPVALNYHPGWGLAYDPATIAPWTAAIERKIAHAAEVGIPMMATSFCKCNDRDDQQAQLATVARLYDRMADLAAGLGVRMLIEVPHLYAIYPTADAALWLFDHLSSPNVGALIDSSHWGIIGYDMDAFLDRLQDRLWHVHLRDSKGLGAPACRETLTLTPGTGAVDFQKLAQALDRVGYTGDVTAEFEYFDVTLDEIERQYDMGLRHLEQAGWEMPATVRY